MPFGEYPFSPFIWLGSGQIWCLLASVFFQEKEQTIVPTFMFANEKNMAKQTKALSEWLAIFRSRRNN